MKVKWGGDDLESALNDYEDDGWEPYDGPRPANGMYTWEITEVRSGVSTNEFPQLRVFLRLDPGSRRDHKQYDGFTMSTKIIVKHDGSTDFRVMPFLNAIGVSVRDFLHNTEAGPPLEDLDYNGKEEFLVKSIGRVRFDGKNPVKVRGYIKPQKDNSDYYDIKFYPPKKDGAPAASDDDPPADEPTEPVAEEQTAPAARRGSARGARSTRGRATGKEAPF